MTADSRPWGWIRSLLGNAIVALLYVSTGWLGHALAVPPGYATVIWPASGIAVAALLFYGPRLAPGVFVGSFAINCIIGALGPGGLHTTAILVAVAIAAGSMLQALFATLTIRRLFGVPAALSSIRQAVAFAALSGPLACIIAASLGVATLSLAGIVPAEQIWGNWLTWWSGDLIGIAVVLPFALFGPWRPWSILWLNRPMAALRLASVLALLVPLGITFYAWKITSQITQERGQEAFAGLANDNLQALTNRVNAYRQALDGAVGLVRASSVVTAEDWRIYIQSLRIDDSLPGISGIGFIESVRADGLDAFVSRLERAGVELQIHPLTDKAEKFVITYIEPLEPNRRALGLDIAFEDNRYLAASRARDDATTIISDRIFLVQDAAQTPGFLMLAPVYDPRKPAATVAQRRAALLGWVYAPFVANRFMADLTTSQGNTLNLSVYDGESAAPDALLFSSMPGQDGAPGTYAVEQTVDWLGQHWTLHWESTARFDAAVNDSEATLVLFGGLVLSLLFGGYLLSFAAREAAAQRTVTQKTLEIAAREQQNLSIVGTAVVAIIVFDEHGTTLSANKAAEKIFGYDGQSMVGTTIRDLLLPSGSDLSSETLATLMTRQLVQFKSDRGHEASTTTARRLDGKKLFLDLQLNPFTTETGELRYTAVLRDVTEQHRTTRALQQAEERWSFALRGSNIGVFDIDLATGNSIVSETWKTMLGFAPNEKIIPQDEWIERVHPDDLGMVRAADEDCFAGRVERSKIEYRIRHHDGSWVWLRSDAIVTERDDTGKALRFVGTQSDITALKQAESQLRASEERLRSAIDNAPIGMALIDLDGSWLRVNDAMCDLLGYDEGELLSTTVHSIIFPEDIEIDQANVGRLLSGEIATFQAEKRYIHKDGHTIWAQLSVSLSRDEDGTPEYFISQIQDISLRKQMDRLKSEFISSVSHELRTPMTSIRGALGLITGALAAGVPPKVLRLLTIAHKSSEQLILLINDILDVEKLAADKIVFEFGNHNLVEQIEQAIDANAAYAEQFDVHYHFDVGTPAVEVRVDPMRLQQVLTNLMSNAAKFSPTGAAVELEIQVIGRRARVSVRDHGPGIPPAFRRSIFSPFSQADGSATRSKGGTGLGLHITQQLVERMAGKLDYDSVEGEGATFWVEFDCINRAELSAPDTAGPRILHIEDDVDFSSFVSTALSDHATVYNATTLAEARSRIQTETFDMIIIDLQLADGSGLEALEWLPSIEGKPIFVLTASDAQITDERITLTIVKSTTPDSHLVDAVLGALPRPRETRAA